MNLFAPGKVKCMRNLKINKFVARNQCLLQQGGNSSVKGGDAPDKVTMGHNSFLL